MPLFSRCVLFRNVGNYLPINMVEYTRILNYRAISSVLSEAQHCEYFGGVYVLHLSGKEPLFFGCIARNRVNIPTELGRVLPS